MDIRKTLRRMRLPREIYYKFQFKKQLSKLPKEIFKKNTEELERLKGKYAGKRCFIIGNGPSLTVDDLNKLKNEITFASNRIYTLYEKTEWRPTFFAIQDDSVLENMINYLNMTIHQSKIGFISANNYSICAETIKNNSNVLWMPLRFCPPKKNLYRFSMDVDRKVFEGLTITYSCMQIAAYMGFSEIYLIGTDHNYPIELDEDGNIVKSDDTVESHFAEAKVEQSAVSLPKVVEMTRAYISAEKYSRENGFRIYNATRGGKLEVFQRVDFDTLFKQ